MSQPKPVNTNTNTAINPNEPVYRAGHPLANEVRAKAICWNPNLSGPPGEKIAWHWNFRGKPRQPLKVGMFSNAHETRAFIAQREKCDPYDIIVSIK